MLRVFDTAQGKTHALFSMLCALGSPYELMNSRTAELLFY